MGNYEKQYKLMKKCWCRDSIIYIYIYIRSLYNKLCTSDLEVEERLAITTAQFMKWQDLQYPEYFASHKYCKWTYHRYPLPCRCKTKDISEETNIWCQVNYEETSMYFLTTKTKNRIDSNTWCLWKQRVRNAEGSGKREPDEDR